VNKDLSPWQKIESQFIKLGNIETFSKKDIIVSQSESLNKVYMIREGLVRCYDINSTGQESTITFMNRYNIFPLSWILTPNTNKTLYYYEAYRDTSCYVADRQRMLDVIYADTNILSFLLSTINTAYINQTSRVINLLHSRLSDRVEYILYYLGARLGKKSGSIYTIPYIFSHEEIAKMAGASREAVSLEMLKLKKSGFYTKIDQTIQIDISKTKTDIGSKQLQV
jgi:CRP-like cAMP-binding protein